MAWGRVAVGVRFSWLVVLFFRCTGRAWSHFKKSFEARTWGSVLGRKHRKKKQKTCSEVKKSDIFDEKNTSQKCQVTLGRHFSKYPLSNIVFRRNLLSPLFFSQGVSGSVHMRRSAVWIEVVQKSLWKLCNRIFLAREKNYVWAKSFFLVLVNRRSRDVKEHNFLSFMAGHWSFFIFFHNCLH